MIPLRIERRDFPYSYWKAEIPLTNESVQRMCKYVWYGKQESV